MKKLLAIGGAIGVVALVVAFTTLTTNAPSPAPEASTSKAPLVTVTSGEVSVIKDGTTRTLGVPEEIQPPFTLLAKAGGSAVASFPDGSELRLDENSELLVDAASYTPENGGITVHAKLTIGRVWSSIVALVTPESAWEVETSNVVATVRGTAFGVEVHSDKKTTITGSEHTVELTLIDPDTGKRDEGRKLGLAEDEVVVIGDDDARDTTKEFPSARKRTDDDANNPWVKKNEEQKELRDAEEAAAETVGNTGLVETGTGEASALPTPTAPKPTPIPETRTTPKPVSVAITPSRTLGGITEGTPVTLTATLTFSDGTKKDVSRETVWAIIGKVGSVQGNTFTPLLDSSVSELGRAYGSITATWKDSVTGASLTASTDIFEVKPTIVFGIQEG